jgi:hypothetical protein
MSGKLLVPMRMIMIPNISRNTNPSGRCSATDSTGTGPLCCAPDADFEEADPADAEEDLERYRAECRAVDAALEGAKLDDTFTFREKTTSVRWMRQHLVEEQLRVGRYASPSSSAAAWALARDAP